MDHVIGSQGWQWRTWMISSSPHDHFPHLAVCFVRCLVVVAAKVEKVKQEDLVSYSEGRDGQNCQGDWSWIGWLVTWVKPFSNALHFRLVNFYGLMIYGLPLLNKDDMKLVVFNGQAFLVWDMVWWLQISFWWWFAQADSKMNGACYTLGTTSRTRNSGFSSNFLGGLDCKWRKTTHGAPQLCNWIAYRFVEIEVGFGPTKWNILFTTFLNSGSSYRPVPGRKNSSFHFAVWEAQKAAVSWQGKGGT